MNTTDNLEQFLPILRTASIFSGMSDSEILSVLHCMGAFVSDKEKDSYLLRAGDTTSTMGLLLSGSAIVIQEDVWGHRNIMAQILPGQTFAEPFAASNGTALNISVVVTKDCSLLYLDIHRILGVCPSACEHHTHLIQNLISVLAKKLLLFNEKITHMSKRTTKEKLLSYLSAEARAVFPLIFLMTASSLPTICAWNVLPCPRSCRACKSRDCLPQIKITLYYSLYRMM